MEVMYLHCACSAHDALVFGFLNFQSLPNVEWHNPLIGVNYMQSWLKKLLISEIGVREFSRLGKDSFFS
jgi:hypothetical protein